MFMDGISCPRRMLPALAIVLSACCLGMPPGRAQSTVNSAKTATAAPATSPTAPNASQPFRIDPKLPSQILTDPTSIVQGRYAIRLPDGYSPYQTQGEAALQTDGSSTQQFATTRRSDGSHALIEIYTLPLPASNLTRAQLLSAAMTQAVSEQGRVWTDMKASTPQYGMINGIAFARVYYKGIYENHAQHGFRALRGLEYICIDNKACIHLIASDTQEDGDETMPVAEAAVLTFAPR